MHLDTLLLQSFIAIAETKSFTKAAAQVMRTQSAVSQQMTKLESFLNVPLFYRGKETTLTADGEIFLSYAKKILPLHSEVFDRFKKPNLQGEISFGLPEDFASVFLSDVLASFTQIHPRILLNVQCDLTLNLFHRFKKKEFDLVLVKMDQPNDFPNGTKVWSEPLEWVSHPNFVPSEEAPLPLIVSPSPCVYRLRAVESLTTCRKKWRIIFSSHNYQSTIAAVRAGMGVTVLPKNMIPKDLIALDPQSYSLPELEDTHISLIKHTDQNSAINSFEEFVLKKLGMPALP